MPNDYTPKQFLRLAEKTLLEEYFVKHGMLAELDWNSMRDGEIDAIHAAWQKLPPDQQEAIEQDFRQIFDVASNVPLSMVDVTSAVIQMRFKGDGIRRPKTLSFRITSPDTCNLKDKPEHLVAKQCLKRWGLERA